MAKKKFFLIGEINSSKLEEVKEQFSEAYHRLQEKGYTVCSPTRQFVMKSVSDNVLRDLILIKDCDCVLVIHGWEKSKAATIEKIYAELMKKEVWVMSENGFIVNDYNGRVL